jgi:hypothetical protein
MNDQQIPWWSPSIPVQADHETTWRDLWDALFGRRETFIRVEHDGSWFICEARNAWEFNGTAADGEVYVTTEIRMTRRQFENLPEFGGF